MGPRERHSTILKPAEEAIIVAFRQRTLLPLDDVMVRLRNQIPDLPLQRLDPLALARPRTGPQTLVPFGLPDPVAQRLVCTEVAKQATGASVMC